MIAYRLKDALYLNLTNRCTNDCTFCLRRSRQGLAGQNLWLQREPSVAEVLAAVDEAVAGENAGKDAAPPPLPFREIVFCGFGEPLLRPDVVRSVAGALRERYPGVRIRIDTNGHVHLVFGRDILAGLAGLVDAISISLNAPTAEEYERLCRPALPGAFPAVVEFAREAVRTIPEVTLTAVSLPGVDLPACRRLAESLGAQFRVRSFIPDEEE